jgi:hypothetical protein
MKLFIISAFILVLSSMANADYSIKNVYKFDNIDMIKNIDNSSIINMTVNGVSEDSNGNKSNSKCIVSLRNNMIKGNCQGTDQDGDVEYSTVERDLTSGNVGKLMRKGGTGKYANKTAVCEYTVMLTDFKVGVGYITGTCKE